MAAKPFENQTNIQWGSEYWTVWYSSHSNTELFEFRFSNGIQKLDKMAAKAFENRTNLSSIRMPGSSQMDHPNPDLSLVVF